MYYFNRLWNEGRMCDIPVYVDSPLSTRATKVHRDHPECYDSDAVAMLNVLAQPDYRDFMSPPVHGRDYFDGLEDGVAGLRIAYSPTLGGQGWADDDVAETNESNNSNLGPGIDLDGVFVIVDGGGNADLLGLGLYLRDNSYTWAPGATMEVDFDIQNTGGTDASPFHVDFYASTDGTVTDYQMSAMAMAIVFNGMSPEELAAWTRSMLHSGEVMEFPEIAARKVDKHSTGGVGDLISLPLAPLVAAAGVPVPMVSGRGLGHTGGTLDKLESIPGRDCRQVLTEGAVRALVVGSARDVQRTFCANVQGARGRRVG